MKKAKRAGIVAGGTAVTVIAMQIFSGTSIEWGTTIWFSLTIALVTLVLDIIFEPKPIRHSVLR